MQEGVIFDYGNATEALFCYQLHIHSGESLGQGVRSARIKYLYDHRMTGSSITKRVLAWNLGRVAKERKAPILMRMKHMNQLGHERSDGYRSSQSFALAICATGSALDLIN